MKKIYLNLVKKKMKKEIKHGWGGARKKSGRKPVADKKQPVTLFIPQSVIDKHGGADAIKEQLIKKFK